MNNEDSQAPEYSGLPDDASQQTGEISHRVPAPSSILSGGALSGGRGGYPTSSAAPSSQAPPYSWATGAPQSSHGAAYSGRSGGASRMTGFSSGTAASLSSLNGVVLRGGGIDRPEVGRPRRRPTLSLSAVAATSSRGPSEVSATTFASGGAAGSASVGGMGAGSESQPSELPQDSAAGLPPLDEGDLSTMKVWGTDINTQALRLKVNHFLQTFQDAAAVAAAVAATQSQSQSEAELLLYGSSREAPEPKYMALVREAVEKGSYAINIDTGDVRAHDPKLYKWLVNYPREVIPIIDVAIAAIAARVYMFQPQLDDREAAEKLAQYNFFCRPFNLSETKHIRQLDPSDVDKLVCVRGMVTRTSSVIADLRYACFQCAACGAEQSAANEGGIVEEPAQCQNCRRKLCFTLLHNRGTYLDRQVVKAQEAPDDIPEGETPRGITLVAYDSLVEVCRPGDRVTVTGTFRAAPVRVNPRHGTMHSLFRTYIDINHVQREEEGRAAFSVAGAGDGGAEEDEEPELDPNDPLDAADVHAEAQASQLHSRTRAQRQEDEDKLRALSRDPDVYERLTASLAPNIWGMEDVKKGVLCLLFGGVPKTLPGGGRIRSEINCLLVGDPSVSKSQLLTYVHRLAPRGIYTSGRGSSAVGLTAYVSRDPETRELVLESGALVLSDRGVCCIDEFDKMSDGARSMLHEAMEQQTVSVAKAGLVSTLNARCAVLACANPVGSRYDPKLSVAENINLVPTLLTRFDLIYLVLDKYEESTDRRLARHLVSLFGPPSTSSTSATGGGEGGADDGADTPTHNLNGGGTTTARQAAAGINGGGGGAGGASSEHLIPQDFLRRYIAFARARCRPVIGDAAAEELAARYVTLRGDGRDKKVVVATPRQLESLIRLSEGLARMRLANEVSPADVREAVRLWYGAMSGAAGGAPGGGLDMDAMYTGMTAVQREALRELPGNLRAKIAQLPRSTVLSVDELLRDLNAAAATAGKPVIRHREDLMAALRQLDDLVVVDEIRNVVRPVGAGGGR